MTSPADIARSVRQMISRLEYEPAERLLREGLAAHPGEADLNNLMCYVLAHVGRTGEALRYAREAAAALPDQPNILTNLGSTLMNLGQLDEAVEVLRRAVSLERVGIASRHALALTLNVAKRFTEAAEVAKEGLEGVVMDPALSMDLANSHLGLARADLAVKVLRGMLSWYPDQPMAVGNLATMLNYVPGLDPVAIRRAHEDYGAMLGRFLPPTNPPRIADPEPERPLRVGMIIPDLINHPVAQFIRPVLERLDAGCSLFIYYTSPADEVEPGWRIVSHTARRVPWHSELQLDQLLRADRLDILIDLCGLTVHHRMPVMHLKPAPIQITYAGYPNTTGIKAIDYRIVDSLTDPRESERLSVEQLIRLDPCFLCFVPPESPGEPVRTPGPLTFASFNHLPKINDPLIRLWARVLRTTPEARLLIKAEALTDPRTRESLRARLVDAGVPESRIEIRPPTATRAEHLAMYAEVDVALDTFPYHGTTTTCEAMFMGVAVVTLAGNTHVSRVGVSLLTNAGTPELIAKTEDEYVALAAGLIKDGGRLAAYRATLRGRLLASPLCDAAAFASRFQAALRSIWREKCGAGLP